MIASGLSWIVFFGGKKIRKEEGFRLRGIRMMKICGKD
jgi:hypothetical protein